MEFMPHRMGHGQHPNLKMDMDGWTWKEKAIFGELTK